MVKFNQINPGMTLTEVYGVLGSWGTLTSQSGRVQKYRWTEDGKGIYLTFYDGKVTGKFQSGLK
mgnify:CR=1 FL=1